MDILERIDEKLSQSDIDLLRSRGKVGKDFKGFTTTRTQGDQKKPGVKQEPAEVPIAVGDIFYDSWGYDQTNIDWWQVVQITGSGKSVKIRPINGKYKETGFMSGQTTPLKGKFKGSAITKRWGISSGSVYINSPSGHGWCSKWDGKPKFSSSYA